MTRTIELSLHRGIEEGVYNRITIQAAIDTLYVEGGGTILLPGGDFYLTMRDSGEDMYPFRGLQKVFYALRLSSDVNFASKGETTLIFKEKPRQNRYQAMFYLPPDTSNVSIDGISFDGSVVEPDEETFEHAILAGAVDGIRILNCKFRNWRGKVVMFQPEIDTKEEALHRTSTCVRIEWCEFSHCMAQAMHFGEVRFGIVSNCTLNNVSMAEKNTSAESIICHGVQDFAFVGINILKWGNICFRGAKYNSTERVSISRLSFVASHKRGVNNCAISADKGVVMNDFRVDGCTIDGSLVEGGGFTGIKCDVNAGLISFNKIIGGGDLTQFVYIGGNCLISMNRFFKGAALSSLVSIGMTVLLEEDNEGVFYVGNNTQGGAIIGPSISTVHNNQFYSQVYIAPSVGRYIDNPTFSTNRVVCDESREALVISGSSRISIRNNILEGSAKEQLVKIIARKGHIVFKDNELILTGSALLALNFIGGVDALLLDGNIASSNTLIPSMKGETRGYFGIRYQREAIEWDDV